MVEIGQIYRFRFQDCDVTLRVLRVIDKMTFSAVVLEDRSVGYPNSSAGRVFEFMWSNAFELIGEVSGYEIE